MLLCQREKGVWSVMGSTKYVCNPFKYTLKSQLSKRRRIMGNREQDQNNREQTSQRQEYILEMKPQLLVIYTCRRENNSEEPTNLSTQTTSVDNRKKLTPEYKQIGPKTLTREDSPRSKKKNKKNRNVQKPEISIELGFKISIKESTQQSRQRLTTRHGFNKESSPGNNHGREGIIQRPVDINNDFPALEQRNCSNPVSKMLMDDEPVDKDSKIHLSFGIGKWNSSKKKCKKDKK